jgi:hypothetical protein
VYSQAINKLVTGAYLKPSTVLSHISKTDRLLRLEANLRKSHKGIPTAKDIVQWKIQADAQVKRENDEAEKVGMVRGLAERRSTPSGLTTFLEDRNEKRKNRRIIDRIKCVSPRYMMYVANSLHSKRKIVEEEVVDVNHHALSATSSS